MKKKFITGMLLLALTATGFSTFTSCKDTEDDLRAELQGSNATLSADLKKLETELNAHKAANVTSIDSLGQILQNKPTETQVKDIVKELTAKYAEQTTVENLLSRVEKLELEDKNPFTPEQVADLIAIAAQASSLNALLDPETGINATVAKLQADLNGENGLTSKVDGLEKWFENIGLTPAQFQDYVKQGEFITSNKAALDQLVKLQDEGTLNETALKALNTVQGNLAGINDMYTTIFKDAQAPEDGWWSYADVMQNIKSNTAAIEALQKDVDSILGRVNDMVTSLLLQATTNPVFGAVNTPFGVNSMVLMSYYGKLATQITKFPSSDQGAEYTGKDVDIDWAAIANGNFYNIQNENLISLDENGKASLGNLWFTVNPGTVNTLDLNGFSLVNSKEEIAKVSLTNIYKDDETEFKFGITSRAAGNGNGLYRATASVAPEDLDAIKINIEPGLKDALVDAVKNHTATDIAHMLKAIYNQLQNVCDANALRYSWTSKDKDANGNWIDRENKVYSNYGLAATAFKPLSFATLYGKSFKQIPTINPIELDKSLVDLNLKPFVIGDVKLDVKLDLGKIEINEVGKTVIEVKVPSHFNDQGVADAWTMEQVDITGDLNKVVAELKKSVDEWFNGKTGEPSLNDKLQSQIESAVNDAFNGPDGLIASIEGQVNDMMGSIQDKLDSLVDKVNKDYLGKVNSLINKVNNVSARINKVLADPNHYLQATMLYKNGSNQLGLLSTNPKQPSQFKGNGEAIELWATTYNFETLCPVFKKFVGVTKVTKNGVDQPDLVSAANNPDHFMGKPFDGEAKCVVLDVKGATAGVYTYEIAYQALDFTGHTSTVKCYVQVVR